MLPTKCIADAKEFEDRHITLLDNELVDEYLYCRPYVYKQRRHVHMYIIYFMLLCYIMLYYVILCYIMLYYVILCYIMLYYIFYIIDTNTNKCLRDFNPPKKTRLVT